MHSAEFWLASVNWYVTKVVPTWKNVPGPFVLETKVTNPERSVAEGSIQVIVVPVSPSSMTSCITAGQLVIVGGVVSTGRKSWDNMWMLD